MIFHGSGEIVKIPEIHTSKYSKDFGIGFYCTIYREQAERWAKRKPYPVVNAYSIDRRISVKTLEFPIMSEEWLDFVVLCRSSSPKKKVHDYDLVIGPMADDQVYFEINRYLDGQISRDQFWTSCKFSYPTQQMCFASEISIESLTFIRNWEGDEL